VFDIGFGEFVLIAIVALLVLGPERLPVTLRAVGRAIREFRRATNELRAQIDVDGSLRDLRRQMDVDDPPVRRKAADAARIYPPEGPDLEDALPEGSPYPPVAPVADPEEP
jgi:sec-independent protein translocase protein TatB